MYCNETRRIISCFFVIAGYSWVDTLYDGSYDVYYCHLSDLDEVDELQLGAPSN